MTLLSYVPHRFHGNDKEVSILGVNIVKTDFLQDQTIAYNQEGAVLAVVDTPIYAKNFPSSAKALDSDLLTYTAVDVLDSILTSLWDSLKIGIFF